MNCFIQTITVNVINTQIHTTKKDSKETRGESLFLMGVIFYDRSFTPGDFLRGSISCLTSVEFYRVQSKLLDVFDVLYKLSNHGIFQRRPLVLAYYQRCNMVHKRQRCMSELWN